MKKIKNYLICQTIMFFALTVLVSLAYLVYQNTFKETIISTRTVATNELRNYMERSINFGKEYNDHFPFTRSIGLTLASVYNDLQIQDILFIDSDGELFYQHEKLDFLSDELLNYFYSHKENTILETENFLWTISPLIKSDLSTQAPVEQFGTYFIAYKITDFNAPLSDFMHIYSMQIIVSYILGFLLVSFLVYGTNFSINEKENKIQGKYKLYIIIILSQVILSAFLLFGFKQMFTQSAVTKAEQRLSMESERITRLLDKGLPLEEYRRAETFYKNELKDSDYLKNFTILDANNTVLTKVNFQEDSSQDTAFIKKDLISKKGTKYGSLNMAISEQAILNKIYASLADILTIFIISILAVTELILFAVLPKARRQHIANPVEKIALVPVSYMRTVMSIFIFSASLAVSFLPITMLNLMENQSLFGLSPMLASSLSASSEFGACLISLFFVGALSDKYGWQTSFILGTSIYVVASFMSAFAFSPISLIAARSLAGFGYGFTWLSSQAFIFTNTSPEKRGLAFALTVAGFYTGYIAGVSTGGILSTQLSAYVVFLFATFSSISAIFFTFIFMRPYFKRKKIRIAVEKEVKQEINKATFWQYITNVNILSTTIFILVSFSLIQVGLLSFGVPIIFTQLEFSSSSVGRAIMIYGLVQVYLAPYITQKSEIIQDKRKLMLAGAFLIFLAFLLTNVSPYLFIVSILILGISGALIGPSQSAFSINQPVSESFGIGKAVSVQRFADKLGQTLGPIFFGALFANYHFEIALSILGSVFVVFAIIFYFISNNNLK